MKTLFFTLLILATVSSLKGQQYTKLKLQLEQNGQLFANEPLAYFDSGMQRTMLYYQNSGVKDPFEIPRKFGNRNGAASRVSALSSFTVVKDINTSKDANPANESFDVRPRSFAVLNKVAYYTADNGINGVELWRSDGTSAETSMVKDINPGAASSNVREIIVAANKLFFTAYTEANGYELWTSDGTENGTKLVKDIAPGIKSAAPSNLISFDGKAFFIVAGNYYPQLWRSDGTTAGTNMFLDFGLKKISGRDPHNFVLADSLLFFTLNMYYRHGTALWRTDGTKTGTYSIKDIIPGNLTAYKNKLYFSDDGNSRKLWSSDGTTAGTNIVSGNNEVILRNDYSYNSAPFAISNGNLFFPGYTPQTGWELYKYNDTSVDGVQIVKNITAGSQSTELYSANIKDVDGTLYFAFLDSLKSMHLWRSDGIGTGTKEIVDLGKVDFNNLFNGGGKLLFNVRTDSTGYELWKSEGNAASTHLVKNIYEGAVSSYPDNFTVCNGLVFFKASNEHAGAELWKTDGSVAGTTIVEDVNKTSSASSSPEYLTLNNNDIYFTAFAPNKGRELWKSDGTSAGTSVVTQSMPGENASSVINNITSKNNFTYFTSALGNGGALYRTDGTHGGTKLIADIPGGYATSYVVTNNGTVFYTVNSYPSGELWKTDGTAAGTLQISNNLSIYYNEYDPKRSEFMGLVALGKSIYFTAFVGGKGFELFKSNGTAAGTGMVKDININGSSYAQHLTLYNNNIYFVADDGNGNALWKSDGSERGTIKLKNMEINSFCISNNLLFVGASNSQTFKGELWVTDGTVQGTKLVTTLNSQNTRFPENLTDVDGALYFSAVDSANENQLWKSDGTSANTKPVKVIAPRIETGDINNFAGSGSQLFFIDNGNLWSSDGTDTGTAIVDVPLAGAFVPNSLRGTADKLYIAGYSYLYGNELYVANTSSSGLSKSDIKTFVVSPQNNFSAQLLKNPVTEQLTIAISTGKTQRTEIVVSNSEGKKMAANSMKILPGTNMATFNTSLWSQGIYFIKIINEDGSVKTLKALK